VSLSALPVTDTRPFFRPVSRELVALLNTLEPADWDRPTIAGRWLVRDVVAHLLDTTMRRLSFHRDRHEPPKPEQPPANEQEFVAFINELNRQWIELARRMSPRVMTDLYARASEDLAAFVESLPLDAPALFPVSWAGEDASAGWFDIGREFTEQFHHQMQIRDAVGAPPLPDPAWLRAFLLIALRGLPHAYRQTRAENGATVSIDVTGPSGGMWTLRRDGERWSLWAGAADRADATIVLSDDTAWRLLFNALPPARAVDRIVTTGEPSLAAPLVHARSVIV
jgi:uncharacterized protein (TIGR03083 family)